MELPRIGVTLGDPGGIGPEVVVKAFSGRHSLPPAEYIFIGSSRLIEEEGRSLGLEVRPGPGPESSSPGWKVSFLDVEIPAKSFVKGKPTVEGGEASFRWFEEAIKEAQKGFLQALVTAPISKQSWALAGLGWRGHTEYIDRLIPGAIMAFWSEKIKVALLSHHLPLKEAISRIKRENLLDFLKRLWMSLETVLGGSPELYVAGLNPHAGEAGILGREEEDEVVPALEEARKMGIRALGPFPPDTVFREVVGRPERIAVALYHDQGLIAFKLLAFETGVNVTLGLPFIRTSPDHGTAFDIASRREADARSMVEAVRLASSLSPAALHIGA